MSTSSTSTPDAETRLRDVLHKVWGFSEFRPLQWEAMRAVLEQRDSVVVLPTGGGKSLCFQAPALVGFDVAQTFRSAGPTDVAQGFSPAGSTTAGRPEGLHYELPEIERPAPAGPREQAGMRGPASAGPRRRGFALVVSPLISLMKDQVDGLRVDGVEAVYLNSSLTAGQRDEVLASLRADSCRLLYVSPERLVGEGSQGFRRMLRQCGVRFVAIDEAHCISQWGHDFRPEYRQLGVLRDDFPDVALHAFTATATERVRRDIVTELRLKNPDVLVGSFDRPNLTYRVLRRSDFHRQLLQILGRHEREAGIVYCLSRREVESLSEWLCEQGYRAVPYHAGLADTVRARHQEEFLDERADIVVATVAFGMGIDRSNVRFVVHAGAPRSPEHYQQESGRAGRDGLPAECVLAYSGADFPRWRQLLEMNGELTDSAKALLRDMERYAAGTRCRHRLLVEYFGEPYERADCGACDWCLKELDAVVDSTVIAQKILSCVARVKQSWGSGHVTDVLTGKASEKVVATRHHELSTFGLLKEESAASVRGYIEQLVEGALLLRDGEPYPVLRLTAAGLSLLKGDGACTLYREVAPPKRKGRERGKRGAGASTGGDTELFDVLRDVRLRIARERGVPPYVVFHDRSLKEMADQRPKTIRELHDIYGVGVKKAADFGAAFIEAIRAFRGAP